MGSVKRRVTYRLYPSKGQAAKLAEMLRAHQRLWNGALEQRIAAWRQHRVSIGYVEQCRQLTELREDDPVYGALNAQSSQVTLKRLDLAMQAFFRRVERGDDPGFPRFKALARFRGWGYKTHGDGWKLLPGERMRHGRLRLSGVGVIPMRGQARTPGEPATLDIRHRRDTWYASVVVECVPVRERGTEENGLDWGVESVATLHTGERIENPRFLVKAEAKLTACQREVAKKRKGSNNQRKAVARLAAAHEKVSNQRADFLHQESARLVARSSLIATEELAVRKMTASARGTVETPGRNVRQKAGLNRSILDGAPSAFLAMLRVKAEEAGCEYVEIPTRTVKPSQTCPACGSIRKKALSERVHSCECGCRMPRDQASALVCLRYALRAGNRPRARGSGQPLPSIHETHAVCSTELRRE